MKTLAKPRPVTTVALVVCIVALSLAVGELMPKAVSAPESTGPGVYKGVIVCLPHKQTDGPQTMECALGLKDKDGHKYGLETQAAATYAVGDEVAITGTLKAPVASSIYDTAGSIEATKIVIETK